METIALTLFFTCLATLVFYIVMAQNLKCVKNYS